MEISIENLGPLKHVEFELKPLTVFIGDNRQGKTQAIVTATTMLGDYGLQESLSHLFDSSELNELKLEIEKLYKDLITASQAEIDIVEFFRKYLLLYYANLGKLAPNCLSDILGYTVPVEETAVTYTFSETEVTKVLSRIRHLKIHDLKLTSIPKIIKECDNSILYLYVDANQKITPPKPVIINTLQILFLGLLHTVGIRNNLHLFPSERAGLSLLINAINPKYQAPRKPDENSPKIPMPYAVRQYMGLIGLMAVSTIEKDPKFANINKELSDLFTTITQDIIRLSSPEPRLPRKIQIQVHDTVLDVQAASSGVKGLIGLSLYLKYIARPGDLIVVDEPEQNLHPNQQAALIEFLTLLVHNNIRVAITTHSPYIIQHLQNLILAHDLKGKKEIIDSLYLKREDALIDKEKVGVYLFQNSTAENILMDDGEINWQTFCDTANTIENITDLIYGKQYKEQECRMDTGEKSVTEDEPKYRE